MRLLERLWGRTPGPLLARYGDLFLAGLVVGIIAMMIIPLPTPLLDVLITTNISLAVVLLLVCIYVSNALRIATLPSILLITTLFRLGLNVSSTRLILLQADAGAVIRSFGNFVVAGNLVVGGVIFLILTLIQFIVIAKGSERVAEVAARFTLDAMPGKQMAIDADLRAGILEMNQARQLRAALQRESQLYGSMDGAMKFVKGDAIAGILITVINIVGGLLIGVLQRGMPAAEAAQLYSVLTIGDGLVSQIPALLTSTAAGIVVTRVASEDEGAHLGRDIGEQVLAQPRAIALAAGLLLLLAIVPGLPTAPFLVLGVLVASVAYGLKRARREAGSHLSSSALAEAAFEETAPPAAVALEMGAALQPLIEAGAEGGRLLRELIPGLRELLYAELGVLLPGVQVRSVQASGGLGSAWGYRVLLSEIPVSAGEIVPDRSLVLGRREQLQACGLEAEQWRERFIPGIAAPVFEVSREATALLQQADLELIDPATQMVLHLGQVLRGHAAELIGIQETQQLLDVLERTHPALVHEVVPKAISLPLLADVLRRLVEEGISVRNLREILQALAEWGPLERDPVILAERVRGALRRYISHKYAPDAAPLPALLLDPMLEQAVHDSIQRTDRGSYLAMEPELARDIVRAVRNTLNETPVDGTQPVVLTGMEIRRYVRRLLEDELPELAILSYNELLPRVQVQPVARVTVG